MLGAVRPKTKTLPLIVLAALILLNGVLLVLLFRPDQSVTAQPAEQPAVTVSPTESASSSSSTPSDTPEVSGPPSPSESPTPSREPIKPTQTQRLLLVTSSDTAWRAALGDCATPGTVERSTNGGKSWKRLVKTGLAPIVALGTESGGDLYTIGGTGRSCSAQYVAYDRDGIVTASTNNPLGVWFPTPDDRDELNGPGSTKARPCKEHVVGMARLDSSRALVVCTDGAVMNSSDSGMKWRQVARIPQTLAVAAAGNGRYWIAGTTDECDGITVRYLTVNRGDVSRGPERCAPAPDITAEKVAIDVSGSSVWVWVGSEVHKSTDNGRTWS
jgi:hypothetical protein